MGLRLTPERMGITLPEFRATAAEVLATGHLDYLDVSMWDVRKAPDDLGVDGLLNEHLRDIARHGARLGLAGKVPCAADVAWCHQRRGRRARR